jgi:hypothetical protein
MTGLDFTALTDDQLIELIRAALAEAGARGQATVAAAQETWIDEAEKVKIAREAADREAAKFRALERERIAREAAEKVKRDHESRNGQAAKDAARKAALDAAAEARAKESERRQWLIRAASLVDCDPRGICLLYVSTNYGWRVLINKGCNRYSREHLVDWRAKTGEIKTVRKLIGRKPQLIELCAELRATYQPIGEQSFCGDDFDWSDQPLAQEVTT